MIRRMLERLLTFKHGSMYTSDGARGKRVFGTLSISQVIKSACATTQRHNTTEDEVERFIKEWLRRAKERCIQTEKKKVCGNNDNRTRHKLRQDKMRQDDGHGVALLIYSSGHVDAPP
ncbi:hypothetical protein RN001_004212 [Aquatica leii]|uniref:Uncharacterized protein n=1 Tax=Aquatica leii TaxID=1421715 RepID=A0AAN7QJE4_9COLE|nr:hypothetical protein RN001_004212 [Aquatica leii]